MPLVNRLLLLYCYSVLTDGMLYVAYYSVC